MPYTSAHKARTRETILEAARRAFSRLGYEAVRIEDVMEAAGLTRGGFYNHFSSKAELFAAAVESYGLAVPWDGEAAPERSAGELARWMVDFYLSDEMLRNVEVRCPLFGLPGDVARAGGAPKAAYTQLIERTARVFSAALGGTEEAEERAHAIVSLCVGAMLLASTTDEAALQAGLRTAARTQAYALLEA